MTPRGAAEEGTVDDPPRAEPIVDRPQLQAVLDQAMAQRLAVVVAPPGFGKTTALRQAASQRPEGRVRWLSLRADHNAAAGLAELLCGALGDGPGSPALRDLPARVRADGRSLGPAFLRSLVGVLRVLPSCEVIIDDIQVLRDEALCAELVTIVDRAPDDWHFVVAGTHLASPIQRYVAAHELDVIGPEELRFDPEDARRLVRAWGAVVSEAEAGEMVERSGGSAIGLTVTALLLQSPGGTGAVLDGLSGSGDGAVPSLVGRLLDQQSARVRTFLLDTSVLDQLTPSLADHVTGGSDAADILDTLERAGMFVSREVDDAEWFRYQEAFRTGVRSVLRRERPDDERTLLERAADWHLTHDDLDPAADYLRRIGAWDRLIDEILRRGPSVLHDPRWSLQQWFAAIPPEIRARRPELGLFEAGADVLRGDSQRVPRTVEAIDAEDPGLWVLAEQLRTSAEVKEGLLADARRRSEPLAAAVEDLTEDQVPRLRGIIAGRADLTTWVRMVRGIASLGTGDVEGAATDFAIAQGPEASLWDAGALSWRAFAEAWSGELTAADRSARQALKLATELDLHRHAVTAARLALAHVAICRVDRAMADTTLANVEAIGGVDMRPLVRGLLATEQARSALWSGDFDRGLSIVAAEPLGAQAPLFEARQLAVEALLRVATGDLHGAERAATTATCAIADISVARMVIALARDDDAEARRVLEAWPLHPAPRAGWERDVWAAVLAHRAGDASLAAALLAGVVEEAAPERHVSLFRSPRNQVTAVARAVYRSTPDPFVRSIVEGVTWSAVPPPVAQLVEQLTEREYAVLTLLPTHLSNAEIAAQLGISVNTVKTHLKHVYRKLGVQFRTEAVRAAERVGLL